MSIDDLVIRLQAENKTLRERNAELGQFAQDMSEQVKGLREQLATAEQRIEELEQTKKGPQVSSNPTGQSERVL